MNTRSLSTIAIAACTLCTTLLASDPAGTIRKQDSQTRIGSFGTDSQLQAARSQLSENSGISRVVVNDSLGKINAAQSLSAAQSSRIGSGLSGASGNSLGKEAGSIGRATWSAGFDGISVSKQQAAGSILKKDLLQTSQDRPGVSSFSQDAGQLGETVSERIGKL